MFSADRNHTPDEIIISRTNSLALQQIHEISEQQSEARETEKKTQKPELREQIYGKQLKNEQGAQLRFKREKVFGIPFGVCDMDMNQICPSGKYKPLSKVAS